MLYMSEGQVNCMRILKYQGSFKATHTVRHPIKLPSNARWKARTSPHHSRSSLADVWNPCGEERCCFMHCSLSLVCWICRSMLRLIPAPTKVNYQYYQMFKPWTCTNSQVFGLQCIAPILWNQMSSLLWNFIYCLLKKGDCQLTTWWHQF